MSPTDLFAAAGTHRTMEQVVRWCATVGRDVVDIVVQDEFTHDVVVVVPGLFLVYDST
jgi:hypothetical protein